MKKIEYRRDIDGLRAIAVIAVIIYHLKESWLSGGFLGVDIFLVISGFIMTKIIFSEKFSITNFYINRLKRILPAFLFVLSITFIFAFLVYSTAEWQIFGARLKKSLMFILNNFYSSKNIEYGELSFFDPLMHTWSLGLEMQFYILYSIVMVILFYFKSKISLLKKVDNLYVILVFFTISLFISEVLLKKGMDKQAFYLLFPRIWEFIAGGFIALISNKININENEFQNIKLSSFLGVIGILLIAISFIFVKYETSLGLRSIAIVLGSALVILSGSINKNSIVSKILSLKYITFIGLISYSLYLWHWSIIAFAKQIYGNNIAIIYLILMGLTPFILAYLTYKFIEKPLRNPNFIFYKLIGTLLSKVVLFNKKYLYNIVILILTFCFVTALYFSFNSILKFDEKTRGIERKISEDARIYNFINDLNNKEYAKFPSKNNKIDFIYLGDSMTANYSILPQKLSREYNLGFYYRYIDHYYYNEKNYDNSTNKKVFNIFFENLQYILKNNKISFVLLSYGFWTISPNINKILNELKKRNIKIIILGIVPFYVNDPRIYLFNTKLRNILINNVDCFKKRKTEYMISNAKKVAKKYNALYLDPSEYFKGEYIDGKNYYRDNTHLNTTGAKFLYSQVKDDFIPKILEFMYGKNLPKKIESID